MRLLRYEIARIYSFWRESRTLASNESGSPIEALGHTCTHCVQCGVTIEHAHPLQQTEFFRAANGRPAAAHAEFAVDVLGMRPQRV
jgi:hypothetical protein